MTMTPRTLAAALANSGRPTHDKPMLAVYRALIAAGADPGVAYSATCLAHDIAAGYEWKILDTARAVQAAMRVKHAEKFPAGQWARLRAYFGLSAFLLHDNAPEIREWAMLPGPRDAVAADFAEA